MPEPGDLITAFSPQPGRCFRMVYSRQLQADHCRQSPAWKGSVAGREGALVVRRGVSTSRSECDERAGGGFCTACPITASLKERALRQLGFNMRSAVVHR